MMLDTFAEFVDWRFVLRRSNVLVLSLGLIIGGSAHPQVVEPRFPAPQISVQEWQSYLAEVNAMPGVHCEDTLDNEYLCESNTLTSIWIFTREGHAAHPAVACGALVTNKRGDVSSISFGGYYAGSEDAYRKWYDPALRKQPKWEVWMRAAHPPPQS